MMKILGKLPPNSHGFRINSTISNCTPKTNTKTTGTTTKYYGKDFSENVIGICHLFPPIDATVEKSSKLLINTALFIK